LRERPHLVASFDLRTERTLEPAPTDPSTKRALGVRVAVAAGGAGHGEGALAADGSAIPGWSVAVSAFGHGGWVPLHTSDVATPDAPVLWESDEYGPDWTCGEPWCSDATIDTWQAADGRLYLDLAPRAAQGASPDPAEVALDYVELRLDYWRTGCEPPSEGEPTGTPDDTPCSDGDPATAGEVCRGYRCVVLVAD